MINGGGVINVYGELIGWPHERAKRKAAEIYDTLLRIFDIAKARGLPSLPAPPTGWRRQRIAAMGRTRPDAGGVLTR